MPIIEQLLVAALQRPGCRIGLTYSKTQAERDVAYGVHTAIHCSVANVYQVPKFGHH